MKWGGDHFELLWARKNKFPLRGLNWPRRVNFTNSSIQSLSLTGLVAAPILCSLHLLLFSPVLNFNRYCLNFQAVFYSMDDKTAVIRAKADDHLFITKQHGNTDRTVHQRKPIFVVVVMGLVGNWRSTPARRRSRSKDGIKNGSTVHNTVWG